MNQTMRTVICILVCGLFTYQTYNAMEFEADVPAMRIRATLTPEQATFYRNMGQTLESIKNLKSFITNPRKIIPGSFALLFGTAAGVKLCSAIDNWHHKNNSKAWNDLKSTAQFAALTTCCIFSAQQKYGYAGVAAVTAAGIFIGSQYPT